MQELLFLLLKTSHQRRWHAWSILQVHDFVVSLYLFPNSLDRLGKSFSDINVWLVCIPLFFSTPFSGVLLGEHSMNVLACWLPSTANFNIPV
jgi:hypothetical protein